MDDTERKLIREHITKLEELLREPVVLNGWERGKEYYVMDDSLSYICRDMREDSAIQSNMMYGLANYFSTEEKCLEIHDKQLLMRLLQRYVDTKEGEKVCWDDNKPKYFIALDNLSGKFYVDSTTSTIQMGQVYFTDKDVAYDAMGIVKRHLARCASYYKQE